MEEKENDFEQQGLDRFTPKGSDSLKNTKSSSKRIAMFMFLGAGALFTLVTAAIMGSQEVIKGGTPPEAIVTPSPGARAIIPSIELRNPDPDPEEQEDLTTSQALEQANQNLPSLPTQTLPVVVPQQVPQVQRNVVRAYGRRNTQQIPFISQARRAAHEQRMAAAAAQTSVGGGGASNPMAAVDALDASLSNGEASMTPGMDMNMDMGSTSSSSEFSSLTDPNGWARKDAFSNQPLPEGYSRHTVTEARSDFEVKAGTVIPCVLISGLNSDLPGNAIAQVSENVWDTATGRYLLIPRGSRLIGTYDNQISYGQNRALVIWSRLIFPDGSSIMLDNLKGTDQSGYTGFKDQVNKHWGSLITSALLISLIGAGVELAEPNNNNNNNNNNNKKNVGNILSERVATSIADALTQIIQREIQRQPTIKIRPGYRFMVMVQKDIIFPKTWRR